MRWPVARLLLECRSELEARDSAAREQQQPQRHAVRCATHSDSGLQTVYPALQFALEALWKAVAIAVDAHAVCPV